MKTDRLKSSKSIQEIFSHGQSQLKFPILAKWIVSSPSDEENPGFYSTPTVSAKKIRKAVDRNLIKRRIKEAVRNDLKTREGDFLKHRIEVIYIFLHQEALPYDQIFKAVQKVNSKILKSLVDSNH